MKHFSGYSYILSLMNCRSAKIAFATCADFCVHMHGKDFRALINDGLIDILFVNEEEAGILEGSDPDTAFESVLFSLVKRQFDLKRLGRNSPNRVMF